MSVGGHAYQLGRRGEALACRWLQQRGYRILDRNFRSKRAEVDIVAIKDGVVVFVEVKTRKKGGPPSSGIMAVDRRKQSRIIQAAQVWTMQHQGMSDMYCRFDVIEIQWAPTDAAIRHIQGAFEE